MPRNGDGSGSGTARCKTDLSLILDNIAKDIESGGNENTIRAIESYLGINDEIQHIRLQLLQSLYAHTRLGYYMKQAITGDLTEDNTDNVVVGDWGITNDPGGCANVKTAIDTLIDLANDMLAPTGDRYRDAADLLYFNRDFIADETVGYIDAALSYVLGNVLYQSFQYPDGVNGRDRCKVDIGLVIESLITDLLTGGNSNTIKAIEFYVTSRLGINFVEDQVLATLEAYNHVKFLGTKAINNLLYPRSSAVTGDQYAAQYTSLAPYRDATITDSNGGVYSDSDCADVKQAWNTLMDTLIDTLSPSGDVGKAVGQLVLFNKNFYHSRS
jgi:hypothetical protein